MCLKLSLCLSTSRTQAGELGTLGWWWAPGKGAQPGQGGEAGAVGPQQGLQSPSWVCTAALSLAGCSFAGVSCCSPAFGDSLIKDIPEHTCHLPLSTQLNLMPCVYLIPGLLSAMPL